MNIEINDLLGLSKPLVKLIETISNGIGKLYEPTSIKRMAEAKATEINSISKSMIDANLLPIKYDDGSVIIDGTDYNEISQRAQGRLAFQEIKKQANIDQTVNYAAQTLSSFNNVSDDPVDIDWVTRFFDSVADVSSEEMQIIWGKILAGEVNQPGSFSLRTLDIVKNLSKKDAKLFTEISPLVLCSEGTKYISSKNEVLSKYEIPYETILHLDECGLVNSSGTLAINPIISKGNSFKVYNHEMIAFCNGKMDDEQKFTFGVHTLTSAGQEIFNIMEASSNDKYFLDVLNDIGSHNKGIISISVHHINDVKNNNINYKLEPIQIIDFDL